MGPLKGKILTFWPKNGHVWPFFKRLAFGTQAPCFGGAMVHQAHKFLELQVRLMSWFFSGAMVPRALKCLELEVRLMSARFFR